MGVSSSAPLALKPHSGAIGIGAAALSLGDVPSRLCTKRPLRPELAWARMYARTHAFTHASGTPRRGALEGHVRWAVQAGRGVGWGQGATGRGANTPSRAHTLLSSPLSSSWSPRPILTRVRAAAASDMYLCMKRRMSLGAYWSNCHRWWSACDGAENATPYQLSSMTCM